MAKRSRLRTGLGRRARRNREETQADGKSGVRFPLNAEASPKGRPMDAHRKPIGRRSDYDKFMAYLPGYRPLPMTGLTSAAIASQFKALSRLN